MIEQLDLREDRGVLHVTCTARGRLPRGKSAKSQIVFGGDPRERTKVVEWRLVAVRRRGVARSGERGLGIHPPRRKHRSLNLRRGMLHEAQGSAEHAGQLERGDEQESGHRLEREAVAGPGAH